MNEMSNGESMFDVFLCHNSKDKPAVRELRDLLTRGEIRAWLDEDDLPMGVPWQEELEKAIEAIGAVAVCIGPSGIGPWQNQEMRAYLEQFVQQGSSVTPVLLPEATDQPTLPIFLNRFTYVDMRPEYSDDNLHRLICGIFKSAPSRRPKAKIIAIPQPVEPAPNPEELPPAPPNPAESRDEDRNRNIQNFIAEELLAAVCRQLNSEKEPYRSLRRGVVARLGNGEYDADDLSLEFISDALATKLGEVMSELRRCVEQLHTGEHAADMHRLIDSVSAAALNAAAVSPLRESLKDGHIKIPEFADLPLCEAVFTALYEKPATYVPKQSFEQSKIYMIEPASTRPEQRNREVRRRLVEEYFRDRVQRQAGESQDSYERRLDDFAARKLPEVLRTAREDEQPWIILFADTAAAVKREFENDVALWLHVIKVESSPEADHIVPDMIALQERLRAMYEKLDELRGKR